MGNNCTGKSIAKEETTAKYVQFLNQYAHLNHKGKIICYCCRGHGVLAHYLDFEGFTQQHMRFWSSQRYEVYLMQKKKRKKFCG